jgi:hypothetical protein
MSNHTAPDPSAQVNLLEVVLAYARRGWRVFPLHTATNTGCSCGKDCGKDRGKHPRVKDWPHVATTDPEQIRRWWTRWRAANIAILAGDGLIIVDIDPRNGGDLTIEDLEAEHGKFPETVESVTGSGGRHLFYQHSGAKCQRWPATLGPGVDIKADGGYVVAPPSLHASGQRYEWEATSHPDDVPIAPLPAWFPIHKDIPTETHDPFQPHTTEAGDGTPGNDFNQRATVEEIRAILTRHGWIVAEHRDGVDYLRRPGKQAGSHSATLGAVAPNIFYCFSTNGHPFEAHHGYKPFSVYGLLEHAGDFKAAAKVLADAGYGRQRDYDVTNDNGQPHDEFDGEVGDTSTKDDMPGEQADAAAGEEHHHAKNGDGQQRKRRTRLILNHQKKPVPCQHNSLIWLEQTKIAAKISMDTFRQVILIGDEVIGDHTIIEHVRRIEAQWLVPWKKAYAHDALISVASRKKFSSLKNWLESLRWDNTPRVNHFFHRYYQSEGGDYAAACGRVFFFSAVARAYEPGCQADVMVTLIGKQGIGKSRSLAELVPTFDWYTDDLGGDLYDRKAGEGLQGKWIIEFGEFERINRATLETVKAFLSRRVDHYRPPYGRIPADFPRQCVFVGTTNKDQPLQDIENRRFMPLWCEGPVKTIDPATRDQLWAEAVSRYKAGEKWWITEPHILAVVSQQQDNARQHDEWEQILKEWLDRSKAQNVTINTAAAHLNITEDRLDKSTQTRLGLVLKALGYQRCDGGKYASPRYVYRKQGGSNS